MSDEPEATPERPTVGPRIIGMAEEKPLPIVKQKLREAPKREPLPWPELRSYVNALRDEVENPELKELFRTLPMTLRDEVCENVRTFQKGARKPLSQYAAKQLARASHTARRQRKGAQPTTEIPEALGQAMAAELIASLEPERAAAVILPKRDLLDRESRDARRKQKLEEDRLRDEERKRRREDAKSSKQQTSFGDVGGTKIHGLDAIAAQLFGAGQEPAVDEAPADAPPTTE